MKEMSFKSGVKGGWRPLGEGVPLVQSDQMS